MAIILSKELAEAIDTMIDKSTAVMHAKNALEDLKAEQTMANSRLQPTQKIAAMLRDHFKQFMPELKDVCVYVQFTPQNCISKFRIYVHSILVNLNGKDVEVRTYDGGWGMWSGPCSTHHPKLSLTPQEFTSHFKGIKQDLKCYVNWS